MSKDSAESQHVHKDEGVQNNYTLRRESCNKPWPYTLNFEQLTFDLLLDYSVKIDIARFVT